MKMKILITGSSGMLGRALCKELCERYEVIGFDLITPTTHDPRPTTFVQCDITDRERTIAEIVFNKPDIVIHAAAYTDVDGCEGNPEKAHSVNALGTETVTLACQKAKGFLYYISTDFIFDGEKKSAYLESDQPNPVNIYGKSKLEGEKYVQSILKRFIIVRSSWLFGKGGRNFVDSLLKRAENEERIEVVDDQLGSPTYTEDLAQGISKLVNSTNNLSGIYHITNSGSCSWYEFAQAIEEITDLDTNIAPISSEQYPSPARRPKMSILENRRYLECAGKRLRHWKEALKDYLLEVERINAD